MKNNVLMTIIIAIVIGVVGFFGGMQYGKSQAATTTGGQYAQGAQGAAGGQGRGGTGARRGFGGATVGKVVSMDANSITVQLQDGSSKIVNISSTTTYGKTSTASASDVTSGQTIAAMGTTNSDGSVTAQNIQINPMFRRPSGTPGQ